MTEPPLFHPSAAARFEERGLALRTRLADAPPGPVMEEHPWRGNVHVAGEIAATDIVAPITTTFTDKNGNEIGRVIAGNEASRGLRAEAHVEFVSLAEAIRRTPSFREAVSVETVRVWLWEWLIGPAATSLPEWLARHHGEEVKRRRIVIPIHELIIPGRLVLPGVMLFTVDRSVLAELDAYEQSRIGPELSSRLSAQQERRRKDLQGKAAALVEIKAEPAFARDYALDATEAVLGILRLASRGIAVARARSYCTVLGAQAIDTRQTFVLEGTALRPDRSWVVSPGGAPWVLDATLLTASVLPLLAPWYRLLELGPKRNPFQESALKSALILSRATLYDRIGEKLLHALAALESVLLKNDTEPISVSLADRMAFLGEVEPAKRQEKAALVRTIYGYRSRFVHHAEEVDVDEEDLARIESFLLHAMLSLRAVAVASLAGGKREDFLESLDSKKYE